MIIYNFQLILLTKILGIGKLKNFKNERKNHTKLQKKTKKIRKRRKVIKKSKR